ncbi:hypothetical protein KK083_12570 [Fulvivirgaceae bacterium PWU4]|uniref:Uncharacterized protein n=1 Tax=Chryseosolibacter histidini TaxID=2782349 RepID=A0AAP2GPR3_9BACT|nr:SO2930 family diheme c-type cytochrome [Chryseosolibacter histidini]MBT1697717.1 hypothetical protein [Chryseosolibacter histidini]
MKTVLIVGVLLAIFQASFQQQTLFERKEKLSDYGFFQGRLADLKPAQGVVPYTLNSALFSNYAEKLRFVKLPPGTTVEYNDSVVFDFPPGTVLIKNFYFPADFRKPEKGRSILETRLLVHESDGWQAYPYIWNEDQTEAYYDPAGETKTISYINSSGKKITTPYVIPNKNQCKGCHIRNEKLVPVGPSARQLNGDHSYGGTVENQLQHWSTSGLLRGLPARENIPRLAAWDDPKSGDLNARARAYLDVNCAHCHARSGPASTSGLFLDIRENDPAHLGVNKAPVAAGRGAGDLLVDIKPGEPHNSIMIFRMRTNDPAIAMPEIGREQIHKEGVALIEEWIRKNTFAKHQYDK